MATRGSFPHPVLDASDDVSTEFKIFNVSYVPTVEDVEFRFQGKLSDPDLGGLLSSGRARFSARWTCSRTLTGGEVEPLKDRTYADSEGYSFTIDQQLVRGPVRIEFRLIACESIPDYRLAHQHPDYGAATFSIEPGDLLGDAGQIEIHPTKLYDPLNPPLGSCFAFKPTTDLKRGFEADFFYPEHVLVKLAPDLFEALAANAARPQVQIATVVLPALMETLMHMAQAESTGEEDDLQETEWYPALRSLRDQTGLSAGEGALKIAQKMLAYSTDAALQDLLTHPAGDDYDE